MLKKIIWKNMTSNDRRVCLKRADIQNQPDLDAVVQAIITAVKNCGDTALRKFTEQYDGVLIEQFQISELERAHAESQLDEKTKTAILRAQQQLLRFHALQKPEGFQIETIPGVLCEQFVRPINRVGLYIPGGSAPLVSTVLMLGVPAMVANCPNRILCTPPSQDGSIQPAILFAAKICGIEQIYKMGGAQAIAALAYGTESIPKVDKIYGPGNRWVTQAKMLVSQARDGAACDMPAGPSEVMIYADAFANPEFIAADLLAQAEHGVDSQSILITTQKQIADAVCYAIDSQLTILSRKDIAKLSLKNGCAIVVDEIETVFEIINEYAPEHLILHCESPRHYLQKIQSAGSIFLGPWSPETAGDYASGTNHVLPTDGFAKSTSGLSVIDFMKRISVQTLTQTGLVELSETLLQLAGLEGLDAHQNAVKVRLGVK